jgi:hypothetical protein
VEVKCVLLLGMYMYGCLLYLTAFLSIYFSLDVVRQILSLFNIGLSSRTSCPARSW